MPSDQENFSTGISGLDDLLCGLIPGDNIVLQVGSVDEYLKLVTPFVATAKQQQRKIVYFRFAHHAPLFDDSAGIDMVTLDPQSGFEIFLDSIHAIIEKAGKGACFVFDSLSDLVANWYSDQMMGNFFQLTCPYLYDLETIAYFALIRGVHSKFAMNPIMETTQLLLEIYQHDGKLYVHPLKVEHRNSPNMYALHVLDGNEAYPVSSSHTISEILKFSPRSALGVSQRQLGVWTRSFIQAGGLLKKEQKGNAPPEAVKELLHRLLRMAISHDEQVLALAEHYFTLTDMVDMARRLLGTGRIGGKSVGMLLARAILLQADPRWETILESHDSFYIPSDVFYTFLVRNQCWSVRKGDPEAYDYLAAEEARKRMMDGTFPDHMIKRFEDMLDYFGQSPIIVRSSSLLEDNFGNSFVGKYESVFCANQGSPAERLENFLAAVKTVYASSISESALAYRARHNILDKDEQMALLVQRVSGKRHGDLFYPDVAGVGYSFNLFVWNKDIDPEAGMMRLVYGLGTHAVDRAEDDYIRLVALNAPGRAPSSGRENGQSFTQRKVDVIDYSSNQWCTLDASDVLPHDTGASLGLLTTTDREALRFIRERGRKDANIPRLLTFKKLLSDTAFVDDMRTMLQTVQEAYGCPVDIEFTANFQDDERYHINLVQCRPLQLHGGEINHEIPESLTSEKVLLKSTGPVIGYNQTVCIERLIYVVPATYAALSMSDKYTVARLIGQVTHDPDRPTTDTTMLLGPGRWGTSTPELGVTVTFAEIETVNILCEIVEMREDLVPEISFGTHFFSELIEMDMLYMALSPDKEGNHISRDFFERVPNKFLSIVPGAEAFENVIRVIDIADLPGEPCARLHTNTIEQQVIAYIE